MKPGNLLIDKLHAGEKHEIRISVTPDGQKVEIRRYALLSVSSGISIGTSSGRISLTPRLCRAEPASLKLITGSAA